MRVAIFGGSFNPPHVGHELAALYVLETAPVDELWFVPCFKHPFEKELASFDDRFVMCELVAAALGSRARVSRVEAELGGESRTWNTIAALRARHPEVEFSLIVGADLIDEIDGWYRGAELKAKVPLLVVGRQAEAGSPRRAGPGGDRSPGVEEAEPRPAMPAVSSRSIRARLAAGQPVTALLPRGVLTYARARGLYGSAAPQKNDIL